MTSLYPPIEPFDTGYLAVDDIHRIYYEQSGNPQGVPVVFLHGGPGAGSGPKHRQLFDPKHYRIVIFDQRGAGKSKPFAELRQNTTELLVSDIEKLREFLKIKKWHVFGGSWGSTLSLSYAIAHPDRVSSLVLRGIFLMRQKEVDWFIDGIRSIFPDAWQRFSEVLPENERGDILKNYFKLLTHESHGLRLKAAQAWNAFETTCATLLPKPEAIAESRAPDQCLAIARIEAHYFLNNKFTPDSYLLDNIEKIRHIPAVIVQGRYDAVCPMETAWELHQAWPEAAFIVVPDAGHSAFEPGILAELVRATDRFRG